ncbi:hypothetical protein FM019_18065 [Aliiglaciecola sp. M165]|nr:hypothetical protein FM019_18065 [Aliiglaciecola sp. M165]
MNILKTVTISILFISGMCSHIAGATDYANTQTKAVIEAMVDAHGGIDKWRSIPAISFDAIMHNNYHAKHELAWWVARESIDQQTKQVHQNWYLSDAEIAYDGEDVWSRNWNKVNPPTAMLYFFYYFINLPFITQDEGVVLSEVKEFAWPGHGGKVYHEVKMTFKERPVIGKSALDYFVLYIDPITNLLAGYQYAIGNRAMLDALGQPPERKLFGPLWRYIVKNQTVDGLVFPAAFRTMPEADERIVGNHIITDIDISTPFDKTLLSMPKDAIVDNVANR